MNQKKNYKTVFIFPLICLLLLSTGYFFGRLTGINLVKSVIIDGSIAPLVFSNQVRKSIEIIRLLNSKDELERLTGYYSLLDNKIVDENYLLERFQMEKSYPIKRSILWIMSFSDNFDEVTEIYGSIFKGAPVGIKKEILMSLKRVDEYHYLQFVKEHKVGNHLLVP